MRELESADLTDDQEVGVESLVMDRPLESVGLLGVQGVRTAELTHHQLISTRQKSRSA